MRSEVGFIPMSIDEVPSGLVDSSDRPTRSLLRTGCDAPSISPLCPSLGGAIGKTSGSILNLNILLSASEDNPHLGDLMFHQMLVERVVDLQPTDERGDSQVVVAIVHLSHLALKITDILLEALLRLHLDNKKVVVL